MSVKKDNSVLNQSKEKMEDKLINKMSIIIEEQKKGEEIANNESSPKILSSNKDHQSFEIKKRPISDVNTPFNKNLILKEISKEDEDVLRFVLLHCDQNVKAFSQNDFIKASIIHQESFLKESNEKVEQKHIYL